MHPSVVVNVAMSADGKMSTRERRQVKISGAEDFARVDRLKADCDAVMVGIGTVLADDPSLTVKNPDLKSRRQQEGKGEHPVRVVIDSRARISPDASGTQQRRRAAGGGGFGMCGPGAGGHAPEKGDGHCRRGDGSRSRPWYSTNSGRWESGASWWRAAGR